MDPILTRAALPMGLPQAPLIPVYKRSAPAQESILLILRQCQGWTRHLMWKLSLPTFFVRYLLTEILQASRASDEIYSFSSEIKWTIAY